MTVGSLLRVINFSYTFMMKNPTCKNKEKRILLCLLQLCRIVSKGLHFIDRDFETIGNNSNIQK